MAEDVRARVVLVAVLLIDVEAAEVTVLHEVVAVGVVLGAARVLGEVDHHLVEDVAQTALVLALLGLEALGKFGVGPPVEVGGQGVVLPVHQAVGVAEVVAAVEEAGSTEGQADCLGGVHVNLGDELGACVGGVEAGRSRFEGVWRQEVRVVEGTVDVAGGEVDVLRAGWR